MRPGEQVMEPSIPLVGELLGTETRGIAWRDLSLTSLVVRVKMYID